MNFLAIDDLKVSQEGEPIDPLSIIALEFEGKQPIFPVMASSVYDTFLSQVHCSKKPWVIITDIQGTPRLVINANAFINSVLFEFDNFNPMEHCHRPIIISNMESTLGDILPGLQVDAEHI